MKTLLCALSCCLPIWASAATKSSDKMPPESIRAEEYCTKSSPCKEVCGAFYGEFLYLQPNASNLYYAAEAFPFDTSIAVPAASPNWKIFEIDPDYAPGFEVGFITLFPTNHTNVKINWERLHSRDSSSMQTPSADDMVGPIFDIGPNFTAYATAKGKVRSHFDAADLLFGKRLCVFNHLHLNLQAGGTFTRIKQTVSSNYSNLQGTIARSITSPATFTGGGAKFNVDFDYEICKNFCFTGNSAFSLIMGQLKNNTTYKSFSPALTALSIPQPNVQHTTVPNRTQLIPGFEEKLGFSYAVRFNDCSNLTFGLGYRFQIYLNAIQTIDMTAPQVLPSLFVGGSVQAGVYAVGFERTLSNFILSGPYLSANLSF